MIYTSGQKLLSREQLRGIPIPVRKKVGRNWKGVNHGDLADALVIQCHKVGFKIKNETWYCNPNRTAMYGAIDIDGKGTMFEMDIGTPADYSIGVRHDNAGRYAISLAMGARVAVCSNGIFAGDFVLKSRHFKALNLKGIAADGIEEWMSGLRQTDKFIKMLQSTEIDDKDAAYLVTQCSDEGYLNDYSCVSWSYLQKVLINWKRPPYPEFEAKNLFSLYNCFTTVAKELSPMRQMRMFKGLRDLLEAFVDERSLN